MPKALPPRVDIDICVKKKGGRGLTSINGSNINASIQGLKVFIRKDKKYLLQLQETAQTTSTSTGLH